jgi:hypothetical protein
MAIPAQSTRRFRTDARRRLDREGATVRGGRPADQGCAERMHRQLVIRKDVDEGCDPVSNDFEIGYMLHCPIAQIECRRLAGRAKRLDLRVESADCEEVCDQRVPRKRHGLSRTLRRRLTGPPGRGSQDLLGRHQAVSRMCGIARHSSRHCEANHWKSGRNNKNK